MLPDGQRREGLQTLDALSEWSGLELKMALIHGLHGRNLRGDLLGGLTAAVDFALPLALAFGNAALGPAERFTVSAAPSSPDSFPPVGRNTDAGERTNRTDERRRSRALCPAWQRLVCRGTSRPERCCRRHGCCRGRWAPRGICNCVLDASSHWFHIPLFPDSCPGLIHHPNTAAGTFLGISTRGGVVASLTTLVESPRPESSSVHRD